MPFRRCPLWYTLGRKAVLRMDSRISLRNATKWGAALLAGVTLAVLLSGAAGRPTGAGPKVVADDTAVIAVSAKLSGGRPIPIATPAGSRFTITVPSNPSTGYSWRLANRPSAKVVTSAGSKYNEPAEPMPGRGGTETWTFDAVKAGATTISMEYLRPWEKKAQPAKKQLFAVRVE